MKCRYSSSTIHAWLFLTTMILLLSGESFARFNHRDASRIDDDSSLNTESYNDEFSYRYPAAWIDQWNESSMGYRASAGSLSATRFIFTQNIKLDPNPLADFSLAFFSDRKEDYSEIVDQNELRFGMKVINGLRLFVLADTASDKEYSDLGLGGRFFESHSQSLDFNFWSVDHYYNQKTHVEGAQYKKQPTSMDFVWRVQQGNMPFWGDLKIEYDPSFKLSEPLRGQYEGNRLQGHARFNFDQLQDHGFSFLDVSFDHKKELWTESNGLPILGLERNSRILELGTHIEDLEDKRLWIFSIFGIGRQTVWQKSLNEALIKPFSDDEKIPPNHSKRSEFGVTAKVESKILPTCIFMHGLVVNDVAIDEDPTYWKEVEAKYLTSLNWTVGENSGLGLNATWDIDQILRDYPYRKRPFRPWGGGNIQAQILF